MKGTIRPLLFGPLTADKVASDYTKTLESLAMVLHRVTGPLERFSNYERLFKGDPVLQRAIGALYSDLIDFCTRVVRYHSRSPLRKPDPPSYLHLHMFY